MPYTITTSRTEALYDQPGDDRIVKSSRAVATLEEARVTTVAVLTLDHWPAGEPYDGRAWALHAAESLSEPGGTVGPLPDGTVIEVERVEWQWLDGQIGTVARYLREPDGIGAREHALIRTFNAR